MTNEPRSSFGCRIIATYSFISFFLLIMMYVFLEMKSWREAKRTCALLNLQQKLWTHILFNSTLMRIYLYNNVLSIQTTDYRCECVPKRTELEKNNIIVMNGDHLEKSIEIKPIAVTVSQL